MDERTDGCGNINLPLSLVSCTFLRFFSSSMSLRLIPTFDVLPNELGLPVKYLELFLGLAAMRRNMLTISRLIGKTMRLDCIPTITSCQVN